MKNSGYLGTRLSAVANLVDRRRVADIGCDHGKLLEELFRLGKIDYAFASDISEPSVNKAVDLLNANNRNFDFAVGDGLEKINNQHNVEQVVISGMGGLEIIKIMDNNHLKIESFVLCPHNNEIKLKLWLFQNNYEIINDFIVKERHIYYNVLKVNKVDKVKKPKLFDLKYGKENFYGNIDFYYFLMYSRDKFNKLLLSLPKHKQKEIKIELKHVNKAIKKWERLNENNVTISKA